MVLSESNPAFDPARIRLWHGPAPTAGQCWLLEACLAPRPEAIQAWRRWLAESDFEYLDAASHELASLAVLRLGEEAGDGSVARRCRGLTRRAWFVSQLGLAAAARVAAATRAGGRTLLARGDLAMALIGPSFESRTFPVRSLSFGAAPGGHRSATDLLTAARDGAAGEALRSGRLRIESRPSPRQLWESSIAAPEPCAGLRVAPLPLLLADLVTRNWCWGPPGRLRWVLELVTAMDRTPDPEALAAGIVAAASQLGSLAALGAASDVLCGLSAERALEPLRQRLKGERPSRRSRWRLRAVTAPPTSLEGRGLRLLDRLRTRLAP